MRYHNKRKVHVMEKDTKAREGYHKTVAEEASSKDYVIKYNLYVMDQILYKTGKVSKWTLMSQDYRNTRISKKDAVEVANTKIEELYEKTGISKLHLRGGDRFKIRECEETLESNPAAIKEFITQLPVTSGVDRAFEQYRRGEIIEDKNLERFMYYCDNGFSMKGYCNADDLISRLCLILNSTNGKIAMGTDSKMLERFIKLSEEKLKLVKSALEIKNNWQ